MLTLTSEPLTSGSYCDGRPVTFICEGTDIGGSLFWQLNDSTLTSHPFRDGDVFPLSLPNPLDGVSIVIVNATSNQDSNFDFTSLLNATDVSVLMESSLQCLGTGSDSNVLNITILESVGELSIIM